MAIIELARGQMVRIPALQLTNGSEFSGYLKASDGETLILELKDQADGLLPDQVDDLSVMTWSNEGGERACPIIIRSHSPRALVAQVVIQERRGAPRVRADMRVFYEIVPAGKIKEAALEVLEQAETEKEAASEAIRSLDSRDRSLLALQNEMAQLRDIIQELATNIGELTIMAAGGRPSQPPANEARAPLALLNCSSTGIGFIVTEPLQEGNYLRLALTLRTIPKIIIECVGVVVRSQALDRREGEQQGIRCYDAGVRFTHIHERDREKLIHYLSQVQRKLLRDVKEANDATELAEKFTAGLSRP